MAARFTRRLIWVPIIHTQADLGSMTGPVREAYIRRMGRAQFDRHVKMVADLWLTIRREIDGLDLPWPEVRLYQDGLPAGGHEAKIVRDLAEAGSPNHRLLADLMARGATITGTESPDLLLEEYKLAQQTLAPPDAAKGKAPAGHLKAVGRRLLDQRDTFIAGRIAETLEPGRTGLIFLGMLHSLSGRLPPKIEVIQLGHVRRAPHPKRGTSRKGPGGK
jgi:hypothetical protein